MYEGLTYIELLNTSDWKKRREDILKRDKNTCHNCSNLKYISHKTFNVFLVKHDQLWNGLNNSHFEVESRETGKIKIELDFNVSQQALIVSALEPQDGVIYFASDMLDYNVVYAIFSVDKSALERRESNFKVTNVSAYLDFKNIQRAGEVTWYYVKNLHIYHKYYRKDLKPWEYPDDAFQTLCWSCHEELHKTEKIPVYNIQQEYTGELTPCIRCFGAGYFPEYRHVQGGVCFGCNGLRYKEFMK